MADSLDEYRLAGYFLTRSFARPASMSSDLLPDQLVSMSDCLADFVPAPWALDWARYEPSERLQKGLAMGFDANTLPELIAWSTSEFDRAWGWPNVVLNLDAAHEFRQLFLSNMHDFRLLALGLSSDFAEAFLTEARPRGVQEGATAYFTTVHADQRLPAGGSVLGWEVLGYDSGSFHSWLCNGLDRDVATALSIRPGALGLLSSADDARRAADYCGRDDVGAEPALWQPWLVVEYPVH